jgi:hypothetical protein
MTFEYKNNNIELDELKKSSTISVLCNHCGILKENCSVKNYISIISKVRKMNNHFIYDNFRYYPDFYDTITNTYRNKGC